MLEEIGTDRADLLARAASGAPTTCRRRSRAGAGAAAMPARPRNGWPTASPARDADIRLDTAHPEFSAWRWVAPEELPGLIVPFKRAVYLSVVAEFRPLWA